MSFASDSVVTGAAELDKVQRDHAKAMVRRYLKCASDVQRYFPQEYFKLQGVRTDLIPWCVEKVEKAYEVK